MLSYRHSFHAGNHADVLKHICQLQLLNQLSKKAKPWVCIDTHSGAGVYSLQSSEAQKNKEFDSGFSKVAKHTTNDPAIAEYQSLINEFAERKCYPGSPMIAVHKARKQDAIVCMELHNNEISNLKRNMRGTGAHIHHRDGFEGLLAISPPRPSRGLVLIDPPYEQAVEYQNVVSCVQELMRKWPIAIVAIWYPMLTERAGNKAELTDKMLAKLATLPAKSVLNVQMAVQQASPDIGMFGSGMVVINPPWQFDTLIQASLAELTPLLGIDEHANSKVTWLKQEEQN